LDSLVLVRTSDIADLYEQLALRLEQIVRSDVRAPEPVIEDACQFAWSRLVDHAGRVRHETALGWLAKTAVREARRMARREGRELSLDATVEAAGDRVLLSIAPGPDELVERHERLGHIALLPERQQRLLWLHALGLSYVEMAVQTGDTRRTVERQLLRAKRSIRALAPA
jgi:RNA polymerase sigma factor (sigma-70 family)